MLFDCPVTVIVLYSTKRQEIYEKKYMTKKVQEPETKLPKVTIMRSSWLTLMEEKQEKIKNWRSNLESNFYDATL